MDDEIIVRATRRPEKRSHRLLKQIAAGLLETTVADAAPKQGRYVPAVFAALPGLVGIVRSAIRNKEPDPKGDIFDRAMIGLEYARERTNRALGTTDPEGLDEAFLRGAGGMLAPGFGIAGAAGKLARKATAGAGAKTSAAVGKAAEIATELVLPLRNTKLKTAVPVGGAFSAGIQELADIPYDDPNYLSLADTFQARGRLAPEELTPEEAHAADVYRAERRREVEGSILNGRIGTIAGTLGLGALYLSRKAGLKNKLLGAPPPEQLAGMRIESSEVLSSTDLLRSVFIDSTHPIRVISNKLLDAENARRINNFLDLMSNSSIASRAKHMMLTGEIYGTNGQVYKFTPLAPIYKAMAEELDDAQMKRLADAQLAATVLDDRRALRVDTPEAAAFTDYDNARLENIVQEVLKDPLLSKYYTAFRQSWDEMLDYAQKEGLLDFETAQKFRQRNPNYAELARSVDKRWDELHRIHSANAPPEFGSARATEPGRGVQAGAVAQPFSTIPDRWASLIRTAQANNIRRLTLQNLDGRTVGGKPIVERIKDPNRTIDQMGPNEHVIFENGKPQFYIVRDPDLNNALHFYPRVANEALNTFRETFQANVTGPVASAFNLFAFMKSPIYDANYALFTAKGNVSLGFINNVLQSLNPKLNIGGADFTVQFAGILGGIKHAYEGLLNSLSTQLAADLIKENSWMRQVLGDETVRKLADMFAAAYQQSTRAMMDGLGISSSTLFGASDPSRPVAGMEAVSRQFANYQARHAYEEATKGNPTPLKLLVENYARARSVLSNLPLVPFYLGLIDAMHNGFRNATASAEVNRRLAKDIIEFASNMRRLAPDPSVHGSGERIGSEPLRNVAQWYNMLIDSTAYASLGVQSLRNIAEAFARNPEQQLNRIWLTFGPLLAGYAYLRSIDPEYDEQMRRTPIESKLVSFPLPGFELPINPESAPILALALPLVDAMAGFNTGEINTEFVTGLGEMIGLEARGEVIGTQIEQGLGSQLNRINPFDPNANVVVNALRTAGGLMSGEVPDLQTERIIGRQAPARTQEVTGLDQDQSLIGNTMMSANSETALANILGVTGASIVKVMNEFTRTADTDSALARERVAAVLRDGWARGSGLFRPALFPDWVARQSPRTDDNTLMDAKRQGIEAALKLYASAEMTNPMAATSKGKHARIMPDAAATSVLGTEMAIVAQFANAWSRDPRAAWLKSEMNQLTIAQRNLQQRGYLLKPEVQRERENAIAETRRIRARQMLELLKEYEVYVRQATGNPAFTWDNYDFTSAEAARQAASIPQQ